MKKSLNNKIRGKRLVMGDENEVTKDEILIQDKDDKITVKQRGATGEIENISGGSGKHTGFNLEYYWVGSTNGKYNNGYQPLKGIKNADFTELENIMNTVNKLSKPASFTNGDVWCKATLITPMPTNIKTDEYTVEDASHNTLTYYMDASGYDHYKIDIKNATDEILTLNKDSINSGGAYAEVLPKNIIMYDNPFDFGLNTPIAYDIANNILYYYNIISKNNYVEITPTSLAKTIKVYGNYYWTGGTKYNSNNYLNGTIIKYEKLK